MTVYYIAKTGDDSDPGTLAEPWLTIGKANSTLTAGDTVKVRIGTYAEHIAPANSGTSGNGNRITYERYQAEVITLDYSTANSRIIDLLSRNYVTVDGFTLDCNHTARGIRIEDGNRNVVENCTLQYTHEGSHAIALDNALYTVLRNITQIEHGTYGGSQTDALQLRGDSNYTLVENCTFGDAPHTDMLCRDASYCVFRNNTFYNTWEKAGEQAYGYTGDSIHNLWEGNVFHAPNLAADGEDSPGIQMESDKAIFRRNIFLRCQGGGFRPTAWNQDQGRTCRDNRLCHNVFYKNIDGGAHFALYSTANNEEISGNKFKNNIFDGNTYDNDPTKPYAITFRNQFSGLGLEDNIFHYNDILYQTAGADVIHHAHTSTHGVHTLAWYETNYPAEFANNIEADPKFVDEDNDDFHLLSDSPCRNAGTHLTECNGGGTGTAITVDDASWFCDGHGIVDGDDIVIGTDEVTITDINYTTNVITVDQTITWIDDDPVSLTYHGSAPDMGAYEYEYVPVAGGVVCMII